MKVTWTLEDIDKALIPFCGEEIIFLNTLSRGINRRGMLMRAAVKILCHPDLAYKHLEEAKLLRKVCRYEEKTGLII